MRRRSPRKSGPVRPAAKASTARGAAAGAAPRPKAAGATVTDQAMMLAIIV